MCNREQAFQKDVALILRSPKPEEFQLFKRGMTLISMLHYPTRPKRIARLKEYGINSISLDSIVDDKDLRMVENMKAVAWNGLEAAFDWLEKEWPGLVHPKNRPIKVLILGTGMVGKHAIEAATKLGNVERNNDHIASNGLGSVSVSIGRNSASNPSTMRNLMEQADILVEQHNVATHPSRSYLTSGSDGFQNTPSLLTWLLILTRLVIHLLYVASRYSAGKPQSVRFPADDPNGQPVPADSVQTSPHRCDLLCPGSPEACMTHYAQQLEPFMEVLFEKGYDGLSLSGSYFERALYRATLKAWLHGESITTEPPQTPSGTD
jgi:alanine dehydrogenase